MSSPLYSAIKKSLTGRVLTFIVQFIFLAIYARMFTPEQFGVIASLQVFVIFFQLFSEVGIAPALINKQNISVNERNGIISFTLIMGLIVSGLFYCFSFYLNDFYNRENLQDYSLFIAVAIVFQAVSIVPLVALQKESRFITIAKVDIICELVSAVGVISMWYYNYGILALAVRPLLQSISRLFLLWLYSGSTELGRGFIGKEIYHIKSIARFSMYQFGFNFINYFSRNLDNILIGKYIGIVQLGIYDKSYQLMRYPLQLITFAMNPAIQPVLTKHKHDIQYIEKAHTKLANKLLIISIPIGLFIGSNAFEIVYLLFGEQWLAVVPVIEILSIIIPIQMVLSTSGAFFQSINKPELLFYSGIVSALCNVVSIVLGVALGEIIYVAMAISISFLINFFQAYFVLYVFGFKSSPNVFFKEISLVLSRFILFIVSYLVLQEITEINSNGFIVSFIELVKNIIIMLVTLYFLNKKSIKSLVET